MREFRHQRGGWHRRRQRIGRAAAIGFVAALTPALALAQHGATDLWPGLLGAASFGALLALASVVLWQRLRNQREIASLRRTLVASADWWWRTDAEGRVVEAQVGRRRLPWLQIESLLNKPLANGMFEGSEAGLKALQAALDARTPFFDLVLRAQAGEAAHPVSLSGAPLFSSTGSFAGFAGVGRDLAELARLLEPTPTADNSAEAQRLRADYAQRTHQLEIASRELDSFAHSVSHDLRAPLRVVDGFATILLEDYVETGKPLDDLAREHIRRIIAAGSRMNSMIDTLLSMSRMTNRELARERVDLSQLARELAEDLRTQDQNQKSGRRVNFVIGEGLAADGDPTLLRLVLQNLIGNAHKFSTKVGEARVEFGVKLDNEQPVYFVRDNGAGFDMRFAEKLFGLFQRFHSANEFPGTGVGLATVQRIVRKHGGRIWAESSPGQGATFYFTLWERGPALH